MFGQSFPVAPKTGTTSSHQTDWVVGLRGGDSGVLGLCRVIPPSPFRLRALEKLLGRFLVVLAFPVKE